MNVYEMRIPPQDYDKSHTSKGNQLKWQQDGYWYKADQFGYEGVAESVVTHFLKLLEVPFPYVSYEPALIQYEGKQYSGCRSRDFYLENPSLEGYEILPLERMHRQYTGRGLSKHLGQMAEVESRISYTVDFVRDITGLSGFSDYLSYLVQLDAFFLNEDRHTNNLSVLWNPETDEYTYCPYYDFGLSLFSDTKEDFPLYMDYEACRKIIQAKPFSVGFDEQLDVCEKTGKYELRFPFRREKMWNETKLALREADADKQIKERVQATLAFQAHKYGYMFA